MVDALWATDRALKEEVNRTLGTETAAATERRTGPPETRFSINETREKTIKEQMRLYRAGKLPSYQDFYFGTADQALDAAGFDKRPVVMSQSDFAKSRKEKHNTPPRVWNQLMNDISDPVLTFEIGDRIGVLTKDIDGDGKKLLVGVQLNAELDGETVNRVKSVYGLDHPAEWFANQIKEGKKLHFFDEKEASLQSVMAQPETGRLDKPTERASISKVTQQKQEVKTDLSMTEDTDADYMAAVERGDTETAQRMVDEAAKKAGYARRMWHGAKKGKNGLTPDPSCLLLK